MEHQQRSLSSDAKGEFEDLFIQIFDPSANLSKKSSYVSGGERSGLGGENGNKRVTDNGVKWLTNSAKSGMLVREPQVVSAGKDKAAIIFERYDKATDNKYTYSGVYYCIIDSKGQIVSKLRCFSKTANLNSCVMPVYSKGSIYWVGNNRRDSSDTVYVYSIKLD